MCLGQLKNGREKRYRTYETRHRPIPGRSVHDDVNQNEGQRRAADGGFQCDIGQTESPIMNCHGIAPPETIPWQPMKAYDVSYSGDIAALRAAVTQCGGVLYAESSRRVIVVVPADVSLARIREILETGGNGAMLLHGEELGPP
jgi:hypothetical protein